MNVIDIFEKKSNCFKSDEYQLESNDVLEIVREELEKEGFDVEKSKNSQDKITVPVLYGKNGKLEKCFDVDGYNSSTKTVIEVEAGRAVSNYQFLKDLFQASVMVDVDCLIIAVRKCYRTSKDFEKIIQFMNTLFASNRLQLPLKMILIIGY